MNPETILQALGAASPELLELPSREAPARSVRRPLRKALLLAAAVVLLVTTVFGAAAGVRWAVKRWSADAKIGERSLDGNWYELYFENNPAAPDAPETLAQLWLPKAPEGYVREHAAISYGTAFETENRAVWTLGDWAAELEAAVDAWAEAHPKALTAEELAVWEAEHPAPSLRLDEVSFSQKPLKALLGGDVFAVFGTVAPEKLTRSGEILGDTEYVVYTYAGEEQDPGAPGTWYFWLDEARHYIFCMEFSEGVPQADREAFLRSVKPVDRETWLSRCGVEAWQTRQETNARENRGRAAREETLLPVDRFYTADFAPEGYEASDVLVIPGAGVPLVHMQEWQDGKGHSISFLQGWTMDEDDFDGWDHSVRSLGGAEADIWVTSYPGESSGETWREEFWRFTAPDGQTVLFLEFFTCDDSDLPDELKLSLFWSVREANPEESVR